jgi:pyruvate formate lyase activating enzyme
MVIGGLQKLSMVDYPGRMCATVFLRGCNLRCPFCHNASLVLPERFGDAAGEDDVLNYLTKRQKMLDGVCITGGEPLMSDGVADFIKRVRELGYKVKLDTNGTYPHKMSELLSAGLLDYVALDIKNSRAKYAQTAGCAGIDVSLVEDSERILRASGILYELRTTVVYPMHTLEDIEEIGRWFRGAPRYFLQCFRDSGDLVGEAGGGYTESAMRSFADAARPYFGEVAIRGL